MRYFATTYECVQRRGGSEEGGWYYHSNYVKSVRAFKSRRKAIKWMRWYAGQMGIPSHAILGNDYDGPDFDDRIGHHPFEKFNLWNVGRLLNWRGVITGWQITSERYDQGEWIHLSQVPRDCEDTKKATYE